MTPSSSPAAVASFAPLDVTAHGLWRGREMEGAARLQLGDDLRLVPSGDARPVVLRAHELDGLAVPDGTTTLVLFVAGSDVLELEGGAPAAPAIERWATRLPELTRELRAMGARRGAGPEHDRFFAPLLEARGRAEAGVGWQAQHAAFAPAALRGAVERALGDFAAERHPHSPPDRRALEAELDEYAGCVVGALDALDAAADALAAAEPRMRLVAWRTWAAAVGRLFAEADRCWLVARPALAAIEPPPPPPPPPGLLRRLLRRGRRA